jgi:hypothetical protein
VAEDPLETVLRLVADGRLTAEEASPILEALEAGQATATSSGAWSGGVASPAGSPGSRFKPGSGAGSRPGPGAGFAPGPGVAPGFAPGPGVPPGFAPGPGVPPGFAPGPGFGPGPSIAFGTGDVGSGRSVRIEVREDGRSVVNLRLPLAIGRFAIDRIPGLSGDQVDRVRAALNSGMTGPVLVVDDGEDSVHIAIE